mmetsp:Transcript_1273/g.2765  ORF Transcript_1273/g.2765 Transcript_1273/m.2765 type:complete len:204 (-) Transcript_1273:223-834(-)
MLLDRLEVWQTSVDILYDMVEKAPAPDDVCTPLTVWLELDDDIVPHLTVRAQIRPPAEIFNRLAAPPVPDHRKHMAIRHRLQVMVRQVGVERQLREAPDRFVVPRDLLEKASSTTTAEQIGIIIVTAVTKQIPIGKEVGHKHLPSRSPLVNFASILIDQVSFPSCTHKHVSRLYACVVSLHDADRPHAELGRRFRHREWSLGG